ncbi:MAG TPA: hypothetical protein VF518_08395, partial [Polyangia bacterium]
MRKSGVKGPGILATILAYLALVSCGGGSKSGAPSGAGGTLSTGGSESSGGTVSTGGVLSTGGVVSSGGALSTGGAAAGGVQGSGGAPGTGGGRGGAPGTDGGRGGAPGTGGASSIRDAGAEVAEVAGPAECPAPPAGAPADAVTALNAENAARVAMGVPCASLVLTLCTSALNHCNYYTTNQGSATCQAPSAHNEISGCPQFTGADPGARIKAAGYSGGNGWSECMAFLGNPAGAVKTFIDSVYHRTPVLSPWYRDMGYGGGTGCDTIDFGPGTATAKTVTAVYPYSGQTGVPLSFNGAQEGPTPPVPSTGWPSGYPITLYGQGITVSSHQIVVDGTTTPLVHQWLDGDSTLGSTAKVLYTDTPLTANTTYHVTITG